MHEHICSLHTSHRIGVRELQRNVEVQPQVISASPLDAISKVKLTGNFTAMLKWVRKIEGLLQAL